MDIQTLGNSIAICLMVVIVFWLIYLVMALRFEIRHTNWIEYIDDKEVDNNNFNNNKINHDKKSK